MAPVVAAVAIYAAATAVESVIAAAVIGAVIGAAAAAIEGKDINQGAMSGALMGAGSSIIGGLSSPGGSATAGVQGGTEAATAGQMAVDLETGMSAYPGAVEAATQAGAAMPQITTQTAQPAVAATSQPQGILSRAGGWLTENPRAADVLGKTVSGAATALLNEQSDQRTIDALMERDKLNRESQKVGGLSQLDTRSVAPSISEFLKTPSWQAQFGAGLLNKRA